MPSRSLQADKSALAPTQDWNFGSRAAHAGCATAHLAIRLWAVGPRPRPLLTRSDMPLFSFEGGNMLMCRYKREGCERKSRILPEFLSSPINPLPPSVSRITQWPATEFTQETTMADKMKTTGLPRRDHLVPQARWASVTVAHLGRTTSLSPSWESRAPGRARSSSWRRATRR